MSVLLLLKLLIKTFTIFALDDSEKNMIYDTIIFLTIIKSITLPTVPMPRTIDRPAFVWTWAVRLYNAHAFEITCPALKAWRVLDCVNSEGGAIQLAVDISKRILLLLFQTNSINIWDQLISAKYRPLQTQHNPISLPSTSLLTSSSISDAPAESFTTTDDGSCCQ